MSGLAKNGRYCDCAKYYFSIALVGKSHKSDNPRYIVKRDQAALAGMVGQVGVVGQDGSPMGIPAGDV